MVELIKEVGISRSFMDANAMAEVVAAKYPLGNVVSCRLYSKQLRTQDNEHYRLQTASGDEYVLRVYQNGRHLLRQESDYQFELAWLTFLHHEGIPVAYPIRRRDGEFLGAINAPEGVRYYALFSLAPGEPMSPMHEDQLYLCGVNMAKIHMVSNGFQSPYSRQPLNSSYLIYRPLARIRHHWGSERQDELSTLLQSGSELKERITRLLGEPSDAQAGMWGVVGGDFHSANTRFDENNQPTFFNFDLCGYGWRAYDIAVFLSNTNILNSSVSLSETFYAGYTSVRKLSDVEQEAVAAFVRIRQIWLMGSFAVREGMAGHTFVASVS